MKVIRHSFPVIDAHVHFGAKYKSEYFEKRYVPEYLRNELSNNGICHCIGLSIFPGEMFEREERYIERIGTNYVSRFAPIDISDAQEKEYEKKIRRLFVNYANMGISGIKLWKNISLVQRRKDGSHWKVTDPELSVIFYEAAERNMPVTIHMADPPDFFRPMNEKNPRLKQLLAMPKWCYASDQELSFEALMEQQEELLEKYRDTTFIVAHMGSWAENLERVAAWLDKYPNMMIDTAACLYELGVQSRESSSFFKRYSERILFGTDLFAGETMNYEKWFRFLETNDSFYAFDEIPENGFGSKKISGLGLSEDILVKIYYENVIKILGNE